MSAIRKARNGLLKPILRSARIDRVSNVAKRFRRIDLSGEALGARCEPGDKLQVMIDGESALSRTRTRSPPAPCARSLGSSRYMTRL